MDSWQLNHAVTPLQVGRTFSATNLRGKFPCPAVPPSLFPFPRSRNKTRGETRTNSTTKQKKKQWRTGDANEMPTHTPKHSVPRRNATITGLERPRRLRHLPLKKNAPRGGATIRPKKPGTARQSEVEQPRTGTPTRERERERRKGQKQQQRNRYTMGR